MTTVFFLHGRDSSDHGTKARYFRHYFPDTIIPFFVGTLEERMAQLEHRVMPQDRLTIIGSSLGGLMATIFALRHPAMTTSLILLAPALNFPDLPKKLPPPLPVPCHLVVGRHDTVTPAADILPVARRLFQNPTINLVDDFHLLRRHFPLMPWPELLDRQDHA